MMLNEVHRISDLLFLITKPSLQASALLQFWKSEISHGGKVINIQRGSEDDFSNGIIIFDLMEANKKAISRWQEILSKCKRGAKLILFNTPEDYPFQNIENWPHLAGVFYSNETQSDLVNGLKLVASGECYFSSRLSSYLITHSGNYRYNNSESAILTQREREILNKLRIGASNIEIAHALFISENTVKTHLYNLFKKLSVKNRTQAVSWANDNLRR